jgi:Na+-driven multidrug efflux pump
MVCHQVELLVAYLVTRTTFPSLALGQKQAIATEVNHQVITIEVGITGIMLLVALLFSHGLATLVFNELNQLLKEPLS